MSPTNPSQPLGPRRSWWVPASSARNSWRMPAIGSDLSWPDPDGPTVAWHVPTSLAARSWRVPATTRPGRWRGTVDASDVTRGAPASEESPAARSTWCAPTAGAPTPEETRAKLVGPVRVRGCVVQDDDLIAEALRAWRIRTLTRVLDAGDPQIRPSRRTGPVFPPAPAAPRSGPDPAPHEASPITGPQDVTVYAPDDLPATVNPAIVAEEDGAPASDDGGFVQALFPDDHLGSDGFPDDPGTDEVHLYDDHLADGRDEHDAGHDGDSVVVAFPAQGLHDEADVVGEPEVDGIAVEPDDVDDFDDLDDFDDFDDFGRIDGVADSAALADVDELDDLDDLADTDHGAGGLTIDPPFPPPPAEPAPRVAPPYIDEPRTTGPRPAVRDGVRGTEHGDRQRFLAEVRRRIALAHATGTAPDPGSGSGSETPPVPVPEPSYVHVDLTDLVGSFVQAVEAAGGVCHYVSGDLPDSLLDLLVAELDVWKTVVSGDEEVRELAERLGHRGVEVTAATPEDAMAAGMGVTSAAAGIAATGALVLDSQRDKGRLAALLPPVHLCLLPIERLVATPSDVLRSLGHAPRPLPSSLMLLTGPSRGDDVEKLLTIGALGPAALHVVLLERRHDL